MTFLAHVPFFLFWHYRFYRRTDRSNRRGNSYRSRKMGWPIKVHGIASDYNLYCLGCRCTSVPKGIAFLFVPLQRRQCRTDGLVTHTHTYMSCVWTKVSRCACIKQSWLCHWYDCEVRTMLRMELSSIIYLDPCILLLTVLNHRNLDVSQRVACFFHPVQVEAPRPWR